MCRYDDTWNSFWETHWALFKDSPRTPKRTVMRNTSRIDWAYWWFLKLGICRLLYGWHHDPFWGPRLVMPSVLLNLPGDWRRSPGRHPSRGVLSKTAREGCRFAPWQVTGKFSKSWDFNSGSYFEVRGITISPPWEHSSPNVTQLNRIKRIWAINNSTNLQKLKICNILTQHAKINSGCNKLMQPSKPVLKHETNIETTFKIMNAHAKLKMTLNMEFDHLGQELLFSP